MKLTKVEMAFFIIAVSALSQCTSSNDKKSEIDREQYLQAHGNDPIALDHEFGTEAQVACSSSVDEYLRSISRYDFAWDDDAKGWNGVKFNKVPRQSTGYGMLTLLTTRVKLSNAFGAFEHKDIFCLYNVASKNFVRFETYDPALDLNSEKSDQSEALPIGNTKSTIVVYDPNDTASKAVADPPKTSKSSEPTSENSLPADQPQL
jgi:hypothetical protein